MDGAERGQQGSEARGRGIAALVLLIFVLLQLGSLGHPLFWQDEGETAMFGQRILEYGYPKVHADGNVVYGIGVPLALAVDEDRDAYRGSFWGQYYLAALGVWLAGDLEDLYAHTRWVRLPFALVGLLGLALLFLSVRPLLASRRGSAAVAAAIFAGLLCLSTSLILHLREVRYYAPALALLAALVWLEMRRPPGREMGGPGRSLAAGLGLVVLFNFFHPAAFAAAGWLSLEWLIWARRSGGGIGRRMRRAWALGLALFAFAGVALGLAQVFEVAGYSRVLAERWSLGPGLYAENLLALVHYLLRYEFLAPLAAAEVALFLGRRARQEGDVGLLRARASLLRLALIYGLVGAANPIFFERYFVPVGPLLALVLVLDLELLWRGLVLTSRPDRRPGRTFAVVCGLVLILLVTLRAGELRGRVMEIARPVRGPVDVAIEFIRANHPAPESLLIATNYEAEPFMYYLGSRVVGRFHGGTLARDAAEAAERPDLVIPRSAQPKTLRAVRRYLLGGSFERHELPVADVAYNNIPELSRGRVLSTTHRFETPEPGRDGPPLIIYERQPAP
ncbi:MAG: hypothetical protein P8Q97_02685 [Myxococcota bacterium]|nr:hypothetical protein [Myxococcota bacterium]